MKKILASTLFIFVVLISNPSISDESLIGKTLYCDSTEVNYIEWKKFPGGFLDIAIHFVYADEARVYQYMFIPDMFETLYDPGTIHEFQTDLSQFKFFDSFPVGKFTLNRQTLVLNHKNWTAQCNLIETKHDNSILNRDKFNEELFKIARDKEKKILTEIKSKNKI
tara:strand:- start:80 stop:577 length:498 start_codon:yes stop_codon:yes gene_type:complete